MIYNCGKIDISDGFQIVSVYGKKNIFNFPELRNYIDFDRDFLRKNDEFWFIMNFSKEKKNYRLICKYSYKVDNFNRHGYSCCYLIYKRNVELSSQEIISIINSLSTNKDIDPKLGKEKRTSISSYKKLNSSFFIEKKDSFNSFIEASLKNNKVNQYNLLTASNSIRTINYLTQNDFFYLPSDKNTHTYIVFFIFSSLLIIVVSIFIYLNFNTILLFDISKQSKNNPQKNPSHQTQNKSLFDNKIEEYIDSCLYKKDKHKKYISFIKEMSSNKKAIYGRKLHDIYVLDSISKKLDSILLECKILKRCNQLMITSCIASLEEVNILCNRDDIEKKIKKAQKIRLKYRKCFISKDFFCIYNSITKEYKAYRTSKHEHIELPILKGSSIEDVIRSIKKSNPTENEKIRLKAFNPLNIDNDSITCNSCNPCDTCNIIIILDKEVKKDTIGAHHNKK